MRVQLALFSILFSQVLTVLSVEVLNEGRSFDPTELNPFKITSVKWMDKDGVVHTDTLTAGIMQRRVDATIKDIRIMLYTMKNPYEYELITPSNFTTMKNSKYFKKTRKNFFIVHGWNNNHESPVNSKLRDALLDLDDVNVFVVDWDKLANRNYFTSKLSVQGIGIGLGTFIQELMDYYDLTSDDVAIMGHSLGAHVAGRAGATMRIKPHFIVGMDPALPFFSFNDLETRLDPSDATYVQVIHTSGGKLGFKSSLGHSDFFPNGGSSQPGCFLDIFGTCAHSRSYELMAASIYQCSSLSRKCDSYYNYEQGLCSDNPESYLGCYQLDRSVQGDFYLNTNSDVPYFLNETTY